MKAAGMRGTRSGYLQRTTRAPAVPGALRHLVRASRFGAPVRPTIEPAPTGTRVPLPWQGLGAYRSDHADPRSYWGHLGCRSRNRRRTLVPEARRDEGSRRRFTSRVTGHRPTGLVDCRDGSAHHQLHPRDRSPSGIGGDCACSGPGVHGGWTAPSRPPRSGRAAAMLPARMSAPADAAPIEVGLDHPRRRDEVRVVADRAGHPVDVRRLEGRDLAERVVVELAERDDRGLGLVERRRRRPAEMAQPVADERAGGRGRARRLAADGIVAQRRLPGQGRPSRSCCRRPGCALDRCRSCRPGRSPGGSASGGGGPPATRLAARVRTSAVAPPGPIARLARS